MTRNSIMLALVAAAALAGCDNQGQTIVVGPGGETNSGIENTEAANVELPPSIAASKVYRCKGNGVVSIDWLSDNKTANIRGDDGSVVQVTAPEEGQTLTAEGYSLSGSATASTITLERPGQGKTTCNA